MPASASAKSKTKFSSRNVNALYKAPALRGGEFSGASSGFRTGGVNGLNRLLVLRGPPRTAGVDANAVAAPTPINTPSLRKEHMGQDIHVSLVPAGRLGGWGDGHDHTHTEKEATEDKSRLTPAEPQQRPQQQQRGEENAWAGGAPTGLLGRARQPVNKVPPSVIPRTGSGSGKWGDDAVEDDLEQEDRQRDIQRKREFPDLHEQQAFYDRVHREQGHGDSMANYHSHREQFPQYDQQGAGSRRDPLHDRDDRDVHPGYGRRPVHSFAPSEDGDELHGPGHHVSLQDARFSSPVRHDVHYRHDQPRGDAQEMYHHSRSHDLARQDRSLEESGYTVHHGERQHHQDIPLPSDPRHMRHDVMSRELPHPSPHPSVRRMPDSTQAIASASSTVWKKGEAEIGIREVAASRSSSHAMMKHLNPIEASAPVSAIRILKRDGPRMLFDHKSGTMVEVDQSKPSRRLNKSTPTPPKEIMEETNSVNQQDLSSKVVRTKYSLSTRSQTASIIDKPPKVVPAATLADSGELDPVTTHAQTVLPSESNQTRSTSTKRRSKEAKTKLLQLGGKMKRVVVAYRAIAKPDDEGQAKDASSTSMNDEKGRTIAPSPQDEIRTAASAANSTKKIATKPRSKSNELMPSAPIDFASRRSGDSNTKSKNNLQSVKAKPRERPTTERTTNAFKQKKSKDKEVASAESSTNQLESNTFNDGGGAFITVKSRRAIMLERKREREELAAALSGFHERGGVKRPSSRVVVPASLARFGKKGLIVGFKQKTGTPHAVVPTCLPILAKAFIDVVRPPVTAPEADVKLPKDAHSEHGDPSSYKTSQRRINETTDPGRDGIAGEGNTENDSTPLRLAKEPIKSTVTGSTRSTSSEMKNDETYSVKSRRSRTSLLATGRRAATTKKPVQMYVRKVPASQNAAATTGAISHESASNPSSEVGLIEAKPPLDGHVKKAQSVSKARATAVKKSANHPDRLQKSQGASETSSSTASEPHPAPHPVEPTSHESSTKRFAKKGRTKAPSNVREQEAHGDRASPTAMDADSVPAVPQPSKISEQPSSSPITEPSANVSRRASKISKGAPPLKSITSTALSHKIYKKVYVAKSTSAASPSAAE